MIVDEDAERGIALCIIIKTETICADWRRIFFAVSRNWTALNWTALQQFLFCNVDCIVFLKFLFYLTTL